MPLAPWQRVVRDYHYKIPCRVKISSSLGHITTGHSHPMKPVPLRLQPLVDVVDTHGTDAIFAAAAHLVPEQQGPLPGCRSRRSGGCQVGHLPAGGQRRPVLGSFPKPEAWGLRRCFSDLLS